MADYKISQYGQVYEDDQIGEVFKEIEKADTLLIGVPIYWYTVGGILKTFIDRLYLLPEAEILKGKKFYLFAQGSAPDEATKNSIDFLANRVATLMGMELKGVVTDTSDGNKIIAKIKELDTKTSLFFSHTDPNMVKWFDETVKSRRTNHNHTKDKKNW